MQGISADFDDIRCRRLQDAGWQDRVAGAAARPGVSITQGQRDLGAIVCAEVERNTRVGKLHRLGKAKHDLGQVGWHLRSARRRVDEVRQAHDSTSVAGHLRAGRGAGRTPFRR